MGDGVSYYSSYGTSAPPRSKKPRLLGPVEHESAVAVMPSTTSARTTTAAGVRRAFAGLDLEAVAAHFGSGADNVAPFVVCGDVSVDVFNEYVGDGEGLRVSLRFLCLSADGRILIVELPTRVHESTIRNFEYLFRVASGNGLEVGSGGSTTAHRGGNPDKEADATFGPLDDTPNRTPPPGQDRTVTDWVTLAVEVGRSQSWADLVVAAEWWCAYEGIQYILLLKISELGERLRYALYDITEPGNLPDPSVSGTIHRNSTGDPAAIVTFDMHRILSIPEDEALPDGVNPVARVDLRAVQNAVIRTLARR